MTDQELVAQDMRRIAQYDTTDDKQFDWQDIAAGGYSALNSALFGIPDILVKAASSDAYQRLQALRERNRAASLVGEIGGALIPTGGGLVKGAGAVAKLAGRGLQAARLGRAAATAARVGQVADTAADIIRTGRGVTGLRGAMTRGALASAEAIAPRLIAGEADLGEAGLSTALGAGIGGAFHGIGRVARRLPEFVDDAKKWADKTILKRANINDRVMRTQRAFMGDDISKYYAELADLAESRELHRGPELDKLVADVKSTWQRMGQSFDASDFKLDAQKVVDAGDVAQAVRRDPTGMMSRVDDIISKTEATDGFVNKRKYLNEILYDPSANIDEKKIARQVLTQIEEQAEKLTGLDIGQAKTDWRLMKPFEAADILDDMRVAKGGLTGGSDTAFKLGLAGMGVGSGIAGLNDVKENPDDPMAWVKLIGAGVLGGSLSGAAREKIGIALAKAIRKMPTDAIAEIAERISKGKLAEVLSKLKIEAPAVAGAKFITGKLAEGEALASPEGQAPITVESPEGQAVEEQKAKYGQEYVDRLGDAMVAYWAENFADSMDYSDYVSRVAELTNDFDPKKTASFLYRDKGERTRFLRDLDVGQRLAGEDIVGAFDRGGLFQSILEPAETARKKMKQSDIIDTIARLVTDEGNLPSEATKKTITADISAILDLDATPEEKKELLFAKLQDKYGMDYNSLRQMGLI